VRQHHHTPNPNKKLSYRRWTSRRALIVNFVLFLALWELEMFQIAKGQSMSLAMVPFDRPQTIFYYCFIATMSLYCTVNKILSYFPNFKEAM